MTLDLVEPLTDLERRDDGVLRLTALVSAACSSFTDFRLLSTTAMNRLTTTKTPTNRKLPK